MSPDSPDTQAPVDQQELTLAETPQTSDAEAASGTARAETDAGPSTGRAEMGPTASPAPGFLLDVRLTVSVEVGRVQIPVRDVMQLGPGSVVELARSASEPVEVLANGRCIGRGEIVVVGEHFGVRLTELGTAP